jgi:hypothetical protein
VSHKGKTLRSERDPRERLDFRGADFTAQGRSEVTSAAFLFVPQRSSCENPRETRPTPQPRNAQTANPCATPRVAPPHILRCDDVAVERRDLFERVAQEQIDAPLGKHGAVSLADAGMPPVRAVVAMIRGGDGGRPHLQPDLA